MRQHQLGALLCAVLAAVDMASAADARTMGSHKAVRAHSAVPIVDAAFGRDFATVKALVARKVDVNQRGRGKTTALHWAARWNNVEAARVLIEAGADPNVVTTLGATPLYFAAMYGGRDMIDLLLSAKAKPDQPVLANKATPLMYAARVGNLESVRLLLRAGANVNAREESRHTTALMWAAAQNHADVVKLLLANGAHPAARSRINERTASNTRPVTGPPVPTTASSAAGSRRDIHGGVAALSLAARTNALRTAEALLAAGAPVDQVSGDGSSALLVAVENVHLDFARLLIAHGADVNLSNRRGLSPLYLAVKAHSTDYGTTPPPHIDQDDLFGFIELLIEKGATVNVRAEDDADAAITPYLRASLCRDVRVVELLLAHGAEPLTSSGRAEYRCAHPDAIDRSSALPPLR